MNLNMDVIWYKKSIVAWLLWPFSLIFDAIVRLRRLIYSLGWLPIYRPPVPVIIVGNITVGGSGKTPLVLAIVELLQDLGKRPAIVSRGYKARTAVFPHVVTAHDQAIHVGDEPKLLYERSSVPVVIDPKRSRAVKYLVEHDLCDVIVADDGLQHYALARDLEIVVVDALRGYGNGFLLPAGPLREPTSRLKSVDLIVRNGAQTGHSYTLVPQRWVNLHHVTRTLPSNEFAGKHANVIAGIGHPQQFFNLVANLGIKATTQIFPDHYSFVAADLATDHPEIPLLMTEKDAVKCRQFAPENAWYLEVEAQLSPQLQSLLTQKIEKLFEAQHG